MQLLDGMVAVWITGWSGRPEVMAGGLFGHPEIEEVEARTGAGLRLL